MEKEFLFIGGPLHAQWLPVGLMAPDEPHPEVKAIDADQEAVAEVGNAPDNLQVAVGDEGDAPGSITRLDYALTYRKRRVVNVPQNAPEETYGVDVYLVEGINDPNQASTLLADAVNHRWFVEHGVPVVRPIGGPPAGPTNGRTPSGLIVPGR